MNIFIVGEREILRRGLRVLFQQRENWRVCGEAGSEAVDEVVDLRPDVAIVDVMMPERRGLEVIHQIAVGSPQTAVLALAARRCEVSVQAALRAGARGFVIDSDAVHELLSAVDELAAGRPFFSADVAEDVVSGYLDGGGRPGRQPMMDDRRAIDRLSPREREVLRLLAQGKRCRDISVALNIGLKTAQAHRGNVMNKLGMHSVGELVRHAIRTGIIEP